MAQANWLAHINLLRNIAAHHGRLWNRKLVITPSFKGTENLSLLQRWMKDEESQTVSKAVARTYKVMTTLPRACPASKYVTACATCAIGY